MGALLHLCELWLANQITREQAIEVSQRFVAAGLSDLDLV
jgi:hypothetical protein